ncbi:hypothetical protein DL764_002445 [Monosporascus ibericus]|uniref:Uncharacterized protein n=1 Tax=Monosporascus ibericus TaxID=155417 RepID=A0A4Q4TKC5_9PEZI|nr:hypothetical protein DL764_002445 [Monosporascus ibericus]
MSFGVGVGDLTLVARSAWRLYKACKESSEDFAQLSVELMSLHAVLIETQDFLTENQTTLDASRRHRLEILCDGCCGALDDLDALVGRYESLGTQAQRTWDRMRFGLRDLSDVKGSSSTARIERKLTKFLTEVQAGLREGSVVATDDVAHAIETANIWTELRRELEDVGISAPAAEENHEFILRRIKSALAEGQLDEKHPCHSEGEDDNFDVQGNGDGGSPGTKGVYSPPSDSGYGGNAPTSVRGSVSSTLSAANKAFEEELRRQQAEWRPGEPGFELGKSMTGETEMSPLSPPVRKRTGPVGRIMKLFKNEKAIIDAASDGDIDRVAECISLGMDVNVRERWGWSALSMCAYGGHKAIARLLLEHGADLDNVDVDGDTPASLAAQRGHANLVIMFDEERAARDLKIREMDSEVPRR